MNACSSGDGVGDYYCEICQMKFCLGCEITHKEENATHSIIEINEFSRRLIERLKKAIPRDVGAADEQDITKAENDFTIKIAELKKFYDYLKDEIGKLNAIIDNIYNEEKKKIEVIKDQVKAAKEALAAARALSDKRKQLRTDVIKYAGDKNIERLITMDNEIKELEKSAQVIPAILLKKKKIEDSSIILTVKTTAIADSFINQIKGCRFIAIKECTSCKRDDSKISSCNICKRLSCYNCGIANCQKCNSTICRECSKCDICSVFFCDNNECTKKCECCSKRCCQKCSMICTTCKKTCCKFSQKKCKGCASINCERCADKCINCVWTLTKEELLKDIILSENNTKVKFEGENRRLGVRGSKIFEKGVHAFEVTLHELKIECGNSGFGLCELARYNECIGKKDLCDISIGVRTNGSPIGVEGSSAKYVKLSSYRCTVDMNELAFHVLGNELM